VEWQEAPLPATTRGPVDDAYVVIGNVHAVGRDLARSLEQRGRPVVVVPTVGLAGGAIRDAIERLGGRPRVVFLGGLDLPGIDAMGTNDDDSAIAAVSADALEVARAVVDGGRGGDVWIVTRAAQVVATGGAAPDQAALWGLGRVIALEHPEVGGGLIDLPRDAGDGADFEAVLAEIDSSDREDQVAWRDGQRFVARLVRATTPPASAPPTTVLRPDASYLVTGGLGGLGLKLARWLADQGARTIVLATRRGLPARATWDSLDPASPVAAQVAAIRAVESLGATVVAVAADVTDRDALEHLFDRFGADLPPIAGVVHAAAELGSAPVASMTGDDLAAVLLPKTRGTRLLHEFTRQRPHDFFVLFSSTTALWGSRHLGHYAAANQFVDAFAHYRHALGLPALSINWGTWDEMRIASSDERELVARAGLIPMPSATALNVLGRLLGRSDLPQIAVASVDWTRLKALYEARRPRPFLSQVGPAPRHRPADEPVRADLTTRLAATPTGERRDVVVDFLRAEVARALSLPSPAGVDIEQGLFEMGMDSLMSLELKSRIENAVGMDLPSTLTFNYPSVRALADFLVANATTAADGPPATIGAVSVVSPMEGAVDDELSEDDVAALLSDRLAKLRTSAHDASR
jgi:acyl carrier protein/NADP-dependent 3-hydroxy acid dehydrogenase YdfG